MAYTERDDLNFLGQLYCIGANKTPFLNMIGGLSGGKQSTSFNFPVAQPWALLARGSSDSVKSETTSISDVTEVTYSRTQDYNTCQIMKYPYGASFAKQSTYGEISNVYKIAGANPVTDEKAFQKSAALKQLAVDLESDFLNSTYVAQSTSATVAKTRGLKDAIDTNTVDASAATLTKALIDQLLIEMSGNGAIFENCVMLVNAFNKTKVSDIYGYSLPSKSVGGVNVETVVTDFGEMGVVLAPFMPTDELYIVEMSVCEPVFTPVKGQIILAIDAPITTAKDGGFIYTQVGLDYGPEEYHGSLTNLATS